MAARKNLIDYKKVAIKCFENKDYNGVKMFFSLAYEKHKNKKLLHFISLCEFAKSYETQARLLFEFYLKHYKNKEIYKEFEQILNLSESKLVLDELEKEKMDENLGLNYKDFLKSEQELGFKKSFENVIFANKLVISSKEDFLDFLEKLYENGYDDLILNYMENLSKHFVQDDKFQILAKKLAKKGKNANKA